ncbi:MAG: RNA polymerase sigma factor SigJ [Alphaproteobacteria bacterium]|nr:RNA polymerase sigma factor SigJ [Alphaproteobacteria bacterium]
MAVAYRMLGSVADAEDVVQEAWVRWAAAEAVRTPRAWLVTVVTRLCLDSLRSARARREHYVGTWLPEPLVGAEPPDDPLLRSSLSYAFLVLLERLSPPQRAAFLLRDVFDEDYDVIAAALHTTPANVRQLVTRARHVATQAPRFDVDPAQQHALLATFGQAAATGDLSALADLLADDAVAYSDGGGKAFAARVPIEGAAKIVKAFQGFARILPPGVTFDLAWVNGQPGLVSRLNGAVYAVHVFDVVDGRIQRLYGMLNPDKLARVA